MNKKLLATAIAAALTVPMSAQAIKFAVSGQVHRVIRFADTGDVSDIQFLDDVSSRTRLRAVGSEDIGNGMKAGIYIEFGVASNNSDQQDLKAANGNDRFGADIRHSALWFGGNWGTVWLGHTSTATDGAQTQDFYTGLSDEYEHAADDVAAIAWRKNQTPMNITVGGTYFNADGGRTDVLRYDSPKFGPVQIKAAVSQNEFWDVAAYADGGLAGGKYKLGIGYSNNGNNNCIGGTAAALGVATPGTASCDRFGLSGGFMFSQGTAISGTWSMADAGDLGAGQDVEADAWAVKLGHAFGNNEISISYGRTDIEAKANAATTSADSEMDYYGVGFNHDIKKAGVEVHANYHRYSLDLNQQARTALGVTGDPDDLDVVMVGARVKFN